MKNEERSKINSENAKSPNWSNKEVKYLRDNYSIKSVKEISNNLDRSKKTIYKKAQKENLVSKQMKSNSNIINLNEEIKAYCFYISKKEDIINFLESIMPYLIVKKKQAKLMIEYLNNKDENNRNKYISKMKEMNRRGVE